MYIDFVLKKKRYQLVNNFINLNLFSKISKQFLFKNMNVLIVRWGEQIGQMYDYPCPMNLNEEVCLHGERYEVTSIKHFFDVKGIKEYKKFPTPFVRYVLKPVPSKSLSY